MIKQGVALLGAVALAGTVATGAFAGELKNAKGDHVMSGTITKIDHKKGTMTVKTAEAPLDLHFPPAAIKGLDKGDEVSVELALKKKKMKMEAAGEHAEHGMAPSETAPSESETAPSESGMEHSEPGTE